MSDPEEIREQLRIPCSDALELMTEHLEGALAPADAERMRAHLTGCAPCSVYLGQLRATIDLVASSQAAEDDADEDRLDALTELFRSRRAT